MGRVIKCILVTKPEQLNQVEGGQTSILMGKNLRTTSPKLIKKEQKILKKLNQGD